MRKMKCESCLFTRLRRCGHYIALLFSMQYDFLSGVSGLETVILKQRQRAQQLQANILQAENGSKTEQREKPRLQQNRTETRKSKNMMSRFLSQSSKMRREGKKICEWMKVSLRNMENAPHEQSIDSIGVSEISGNNRIIGT